jgi:hypothetical protein
MGKAPAKPAAKGKPAAARGKGAAAVGTGAAAGSQPWLGPANRLVLILVGIALVPFALPTLLLLLVGMLPTLAAVIAERGSKRQAWVSVGGLNFAGIVNWMLQLWFQHHTMAYAIELLRTITPLLVAYGGAALGWALHLAMPPLVNAVTAVTSQRRVVTLAAQQKKLVDLWGDGVISREAKPGAAAEPGAAAGAGGAPPTPPPAGATPAPARART